MANDTPDRIDPRILRTRKLLKDAMRELLHEQSFTKITVQDIAQRATVNRATFYAHYLDKEELAASVVIDDLRDLLLKRLGPSARMDRGSLIAFAAGVLEFMGNLHAACAVMARGLQDKAGKTLHRGIADFLDSWMARDSSYTRLFPGCSRGTVSSVLSWSLYGRAQAWSNAPGDEPAEEVCREWIAMFVPEEREPARLR
jgi:AcrR family transcriptional regulator